MHIISSYPATQLPTDQAAGWLIDCVKVLRPTPHKISYFRDIPQADLLAWY